MAKDVVEAVAVSHGVCVHPVPLRRIDPATGATEIVDVPCGATLESKCPPCAKRARSLRIAQCKAGWHLEAEPLFEPDDPTEEQQKLAALRAELEAALVRARAEGLDESPILSSIERVEERLAQSGVRGKPAPSDRPRRVRSTKRRQDVPDLPTRTVEARTIGRTFTAANGRVFRPSIFLTVTCRSYGRVDKEGVPINMDAYDYRSAARDAIHYPKVIDRLWQNMRRVVGYDVQYMGTLEPQRRLAPHLHVLLRGTISRADLRQIVAATYHQVWWPSTEQVRYGGRHLPVWDGDIGAYVDPDSGDPLPTWDQALDALDSGPAAEPSHVVRFGSQLRAEGVLAGSPEADRCIGYVAKYLTKDVGASHDTDDSSPRQIEHHDRLWHALRYEPCSPTCANWLRYGVQPRNPKPDLVPGFCRGKVHRRDSLGFCGRRVLVSRKWSGKTLADHRADRRTWVRDLLGLPDDPETGKYLWVQAAPTDADVLPRENRLLLAIADPQPMARRASPRARRLPHHERPRPIRNQVRGLTPPAHRRMTMTDNLRGHLLTTEEVATRAARQPMHGASLAPGRRRPAVPQGRQHQPLSD